MQRSVRALMRLRRKSNLTRFCEIYAACREIGARRLYLVAKPEFSQLIAAVSQIFLYTGAICHNDIW